MKDRAYYLAGLSHTVSVLEDDALAVVHDVACRLAKAQEIYGFLDLENDGRDFAKEAREEMLDWFAYTSMGRVRGRG